MHNFKNIFISLYFHFHLLPVNPEHTVGSREIAHNKHLLNGLTGTGWQREISKSGVDVSKEKKRILVDSR